MLSLQSFPYRLSNRDVILNRAAVTEMVRHTSLKTRVMRSDPTLVTVGGVPMLSASSRWEWLWRNR